MYCRNCGAKNDEGRSSCVNCGAALEAAATPYVHGTIPNYLVQSILVTVLCCLPFGIPAIVHAAQVNARIQARDFAGARRCSDKAKLWAWLGFGVGLAGGLIYFLFVFIAAVND